MNLKEALKVLELDNTATFADCKTAYRELIRIWHPDRYGHDLKLKKRAEERTKVLNDSMSFIQSLGPEGYEHELRRQRTEDHSNKAKQNDFTSKESPSSGKTKVRSSRLSSLGLIFIIILLTIRVMERRESSSPVRYPSSSELNFKQELEASKVSIVAALPVDDSKTKHDDQEQFSELDTIPTDHIELTELIRQFIPTPLSLGSWATGAQPGTRITWLTEGFGEGSPPYSYCREGVVIITVSGEVTHTRLSTTLAPGTWVLSLCGLHRGYAHLSMHQHHFYDQNISQPFLLNVRDELNAILLQNCFSERIGAGYLFFKMDVEGGSVYLIEDVSCGTAGCFSGIQMFLNEDDAKDALVDLDCYQKGVASE